MRRTETAAGVIMYYHVCLLLISGAHLVSGTQPSSLCSEDDITPFDFNMANAVSSDEVDEKGRYWTGYKFRVKYPLMVTALRGGATEAGFEMAIFQLDEDGEAIEKVVANADAPAYTDRRALGAIEPQPITPDEEEAPPLDDPILLFPGQSFFIAQGEKSSDDDGNHFVIDDLDMDDVFGLFDFFETWGATSFHIEGENGNGKTGNASDMIGEELTASEVNPYVGFVGYSPPSFNFTMSEHAETDGEGSDFWMGYKFTVSCPVAISALRGGATSHEFQLAIFELNNNGTEIAEVLTHVKAPANMRGRTGIGQVYSVTFDEMVFSCTRLQ